MLRVDQVVSGYGPIDVLNHVTINLEKGEIVAVLGANGAGKTTLLRTITGLIRVRKGSVTFGDKVLNGLSPAEVVRCGISHVPEGRHIFPDLTVEENLLLAAYIMPRSQQKSRLDAMYAMFSILAERRRQAGGTLSGGEQQMLALARGLMPNPRLMLLDEPAAGLNDDETRRLTDTVRKIRDEGVTVLLVEHDMTFVMEISDEVVVLDYGRKIAEGPPLMIQKNEEVIKAYLGEELE